MGVMLVAEVEGENKQVISEDGIVDLLAAEQLSLREPLKELWRGMTARQTDGDEPTTVLTGDDLYVCVKRLGLPVSRAACRDLVNSYGSAVRGGVTMEEFVAMLQLS
ncbi:hypothetical protein FOL47_006132 [Perkinsus chesapeaki]|uniref:Uncharacterized protein n=1 Tax=Perkinsus chesapeaki TaxID=330153 RepID=A0A7J6MYK8_PERCH|nr:hypothetical protein FOL47_006132 [Perkinsus chesapeaki]